MVAGVGDERGERGIKPQVDLVVAIALDDLPAVFEEGVEVEVGRDLEGLLRALELADAIEPEDARLAALLDQITESSHRNQGVSVEELAQQHPEHAAEKLLGGEDGLRMFIAASTARAGGQRAPLPVAPGP